LSSDLGYRGYLAGHVNARVVNFSNNEDSVTGAVWELNQRDWKPDIGYSYDQNQDIVSVYYNSIKRQVTDIHESMAMVVQSRSMAIGQGWNVGGIVDSNVDINLLYSFGDSHGAQWERNIQNTLPYYKKLNTVIHE
jgi:hypothetical protein